MRMGKGSQEEDEFGSKKACSLPGLVFALVNGADGKNTNKAKEMRSKHSVTEQRRRSKINERFQILRELIPNTDQKRDKASFLLEVIRVSPIFTGEGYKLLKFIPGMEFRAHEINAMGPPKFARRP
ncbi:hypothetical protein F3Y22_tig00001644pilonHSYRG00054 [Hibiscus syriacus]|uniref:BHLH domain-containing protein n=1 Tax=Hibiscus syriacus TaxID=106335 RepID=A0A6A3D0M2_HIBSY|nr:hypothetical protein F3Y22_tig00001644pilonHSYRG00054 [Hibiscus syriacus]